MLGIQIDNTQEWRGVGGEKEGGRREGRARVLVPGEGGRTASG